MKVYHKLHRIFLTAGYALFSFIILLVYTGNAEAQYVLKLQDAIDIALEQSYNMKSLRLTLTQSEEDYNASRYQFRTQVDMELDVPSWSESIDAVRAPNTLPVYNRTGTKQFSSQLNIRQPLPTDGYLGLRSTLYQRNEFTDLSESDSRIKGKSFLFLIWPGVLINRFSHITHLKPILKEQN